MLTRFALLLLGLSVLVGCSGGGDGLTPLPERTIIVPAYLPYIEEITTSPEILVEGEPFTITIELSAELRPEILNDADIMSNYTIEQTYSRLRKFDGLWQTTLYIETWAIDPSLVGEPISSIVVESPGLGAGFLFLHTQTAERREYGGLQGTYDVGDNPGPWVHDHARYDRYKFEILPAEAGGGE